MRPVIALLSDFGTRDHYAGTMKGVILNICPDATLVDITHEVPAHDVLDGSLQLAAAARYFPAGTIFLAVVDPGVGSARRGIAAEAGDYRFVAPDNGVLTSVAARMGAEEDRRADGPAVCQADGQPHVRGARPFRAGGGLARERHAADRPRAPGPRLSPPRHSRRRGRRIIGGRRGPQRSTGSATSSPTSTARRSSRWRSPAAWK